MTLSVEQVRYKFQGPLVIGDVIPLPFSYDEAYDVKAQFSGDNTPAVLNVDYAVQGQNVTLLKPLGASQTITLYRQTQLDQDSDFPQEAEFDSDKIEDALDKLTMQNQEQAEVLGRCLKFGVDAPASVTSITVDLPEPNKGLKWNEDGTKITNSKYDLDELGDLAKAEADRAQAEADRAKAEADRAEAAATDAEDIFDIVNGRIIRAGDEQVQRIEDKGEEVISHIVSADAVTIGENQTITGRKAFAGTLTVYSVGADINNIVPSNEGGMYFYSGYRNATREAKHTYIYNNLPAAFCDSSWYLVDGYQPLMTTYTKGIKSGDASHISFMQIQGVCDGKSQPAYLDPIRVQMQNTGAAVPLTYLEMGQQNAYFEFPPYADGTADIYTHRRVNRQDVRSINLDTGNFQNQILAGSNMTFTTDAQGHVVLNATNEASLDNTVTVRDDQTVLGKKDFAQDITVNGSTVIHEGNIGTRVDEAVEQSAAFDSKQDKLIAGDFINIDQASNTISAKITPYTAAAWNVLTPAQKAAVPLALIYED